MENNSSTENEKREYPWPSPSADSFREGYLQPTGDYGLSGSGTVTSHATIVQTSGFSSSSATGSETTNRLASSDEGNGGSNRDATSQESALAVPANARSGSALTHASSMETSLNSRQSLDRTAVPSPAESCEDVIIATQDASASKKVGTERRASYEDDDKEMDDERHLEPIKTAPSAAQGPGLRSKKYGSFTEDEVFRVLSRRKTNTTAGRTSADEEEEEEEINRLMSRMFGQNRQNQSEDEKTRHVGLVWKNLTVKGVGLGAALQPTISDPFLALPRLIMGLLSKSGGIQKPPVRTLINDFSGCVRPGEMLLVLGRPGSGCSTFLKVLSNQRYGYKSIEGDVTYGGTSAKKMRKEFTSEVVYNPEEDLQYATLSVEATLRFALKTRTPGKGSRNEGESRSDYVNEFLRVVLKLFWIEHTKSTKVGNEFVRGVSGGEKKRVSIAEALITKASTQCWDNSTKGLDASTALEYVESLRSLTNMAHISTAVALYQAGESLYDKFDKVVLIDEGKCLYYGTTDAAVGYFESLGFERPARWTSADFLTSVTDPHERQVRKGYEDRIPRSAEQFVEAFAKCELHAANLQDIKDFEQRTDEQQRERQIATTKATKSKNYTLPFHKQVVACTHRQFLIMFGDKLSLGGKWGGVLFQSLIVGSLFFDMPATSSGVFLRGGVVFFALLFNTLLALAELTSAFASRPILLKHKSFSFYRPAAYAIAQTVVDIPLVLVQVFIFDVVVYFMSGLGKTASQFFISLLVLWVTTMSMYGFFRAVGSVVPSLDVATRITGIAIQALIVYTGYLIPPRKMHPWFKWLMNINPVGYGFEALMVNEFSFLKIPCEPPYLVPQGHNATPQFQSCTILGSVPGQTFVTGESYLETSFTYGRVHLWRNIGIIFGFWLFFVAVTMLGMELQKPNSGGGAITTFKRGQAPKSVEKAMSSGTTPLDEEKAAAANGEHLQDDTSGSDSNAGVKGIAKNDAIFTFQNVDYTIPTNDGERQLLRDVQGLVRPGKLTALMGASGAGKTTLLNTLAQRVNFGVVTGDFLVDGRPLPKSFQRATGFAEQQDIHEPTATVREAFRFSALLRQPKEVPIQEKYDYCERIIDLLEMRPIAGATIGKIGEGLNQEQRKRLTIGVELSSKPELLLFLDEPTSGLDSGAAFNVIRFLRKLADAGQAILCTIHQPSSVLFEHFDELLLLKAGGRIVYNGPLGHDSRTLIDYFEKNEGKKCPPSSNPAEYMLEVIGAGNPDYKGKDWGDVWASSPEYQDRAKEIQQVLSERMGVSTTSSIDDDREFAMPLSTQVIAVLKRSFVAYYRSPSYLIGKFMLHIVTGLFNSFTFYKLGQSSVDMQSYLFSIFLTLTIAPPLIQQLQPKFLASRSIFQSRESNSKIYSWFAFVTGATLVEIPYSVLAGTAYMMCWWWPSFGLTRSSFEAGYTWMMLMVFELFFVSFGQAIASFSPNDLLASILVPVFFIFVVSFCGIVVPYVTLPYFWKSWMYQVTPFHYLLEGLLGVAVHDVQIVCEPQEFARFSAPPGETCQSYAGPYVAQAGGYLQTGAGGICEFCQYATGDQFAAGFNVYYEHKWLDYGVFWVYVGFNFFIIFFCSWLFLGGMKKIKAVFSPAAKKQKKAAQQMSEKA